MALDDGWIVQTGFRHFRSAGIAYAVRKQWMAGLLELLAARGLKLASVLPVSAAAYWRKRSGAVGTGVVLLREPGRLTAMVGQGGRLLDLDVQPVAGPLEQAATRLFKRVAIAHGAIRHVAEWHAEADSAVSLERIALACLPEVAVTRLPLQAWK